MGVAANQAHGMLTPVSGWPGAVWGPLGLPCPKALGGEENSYGAGSGWRRAQGGGTVMMMGYLYREVEGGEVLEGGSHFEKIIENSSMF